MHNISNGKFHSTFTFSCVDYYGRSPFVSCKYKKRENAIPVSYKFSTFQEQAQVVVCIQITACSQFSLNFAQRQKHTYLVKKILQKFKFVDKYIALAVIVYVFNLSRNTTKRRFVRQECKKVDMITFIRLLATIFVTVSCNIFYIHS